MDLTVNKHCKTFLKKLFSEWYAQQIENQLALGEKVEEINIQFRLSIVKPLHAKWLMQYYNEITSDAGRSVIINGWKAISKVKWNISIHSVPDVYLGHV